MAFPRQTCKCCEPACVVGTDDFNDGVINAKWTTILGDPAEGSGILTLLSDNHEYMIWEDDPRLEVGVTGIKLELDVRFTKDPDHISTPGAYTSGHAFDVIWDWRGDDEFMACKLLFVGSLADPPLKITINDEIIDDPGDLGHFELDPDILPTDWVHITICIYQELDYYGYGETGWKIRVRAGGREQIYDIPEPENLRAGFGAALNGGAGDNYYEVDNWKVSKISANCYCEDPAPCLVYYNDITGANSTDLGSDFEEEVGDWERFNNLLKPPSTGKLKLLIEPPSIGITGVKWQSTWHFGGATGKARWRVNSNSDSYYAEFECTGSNTATLSLYSSSGGLLAGPVNVTSFGWIDPDNVAICITEDTLVATVNNNNAFVSISGITLFDGIYVGLETVGVGTSARFNNLELSKLSPGCEACSGELFCSSCKDSLRPAALTGRVGNIQQGTTTPAECFGASPNDAALLKCPGCAKFNRTSVLTADVGSGPTSFPGITGFESGVSSCGWGVSFGPPNIFSDPSDPDYVCVNMTGAAQNSLRVYIAGNGLNQWAIIGIGETPTPGQDPSYVNNEQSYLWVKYLPDSPDPPDCFTVLDGARLDFVSQTSGCDGGTLLCDGSGSFVVLGVV